jgi:glutaminase
MVPRTAYAIAHDESVDQRPVIVAAVSVNGEEFVAGLHQQNFRIADVAKQLSIFQIRGGDACG